MGQYFIAVNTDRREWIHPHRFGDGLKFWEFTNSSGGFLSALGLLLRKTDDPVPQNDIIGSWAGCKIQIIGDYDSSKLYEKAYDEYKDVSFDVFRELCKDDTCKATLDAKTRWRRHDDMGGLMADKADQEFYKEVFNE